MFRTLFQRDTVETRAMQVTPWGPWTGSMQSAAGMNVSEDSSLNLLAVYGAVQLITDTIATLPRDIYRASASGGNEEVVNKPRWFEQPNPRTDIIEFLTQTLTSLLLDGNAYWAYATDLNFAPVEIHVLNPRDVTVQPNPDGQVVYLVNGVPFTGRLLHLKGITRPGCVKGMSPVEAARQSIGIGLAVQEFAGNFYKNGATLSAAVTVPGPLTKEQSRDMRDAIVRDHSGAGNAHLPMVLANGATWNAISVTPEQAQFLGSREFQAGEIVSQMFLLDPSMLGIAVGRGQNMTYANLEQRGIHLAQFTLMRWIIRLERAFTFLLPKPQFMKFNVDAIQRADLLTRTNAHRIALGPNQPWLTVNEVRELEEEEPLSGFDNLDKPVVAAPVVPAKQPDPQVNVHVYQPPVEVKSDVHNHIEQQQLPLELPSVFVTNQIPEPVINNWLEPAAITVEAAPAPDVRVNVEAALPADVTVNVPEMTPIVHTHVDAPVVNVAAAKSPIVHAHIETMKPVQKRPIHNSEGRLVAIEEWTDPAHKVRKEVVRDEAGRVLGVNEPVARDTDGRISGLEQTDA